MKIDNAKLALYLADQLNDKDKKDFENDVDQIELKKIIKDLDRNDIILNEMNKKIQTKSDFMLKLNTRIDKYEKSQKTWFANLSNHFLNIFEGKSKMLPKYGMLSLLLIVSFTFYKINDNFSINALANEEEDVDLIANVPYEEAEVDSLSINNETQFIYNNNKISK